VSFSIKTNRFLFNFKYLHHFQISLESTKIDFITRQSEVYYRRIKRTHSFWWNMFKWDSRLQKLPSGIQSSVCEYVLTRKAWRSLSHAINVKEKKRSWACRSRRWWCRKERHMRYRFHHFSFILSRFFLKIVVLFNVQSRGRLEDQVILLNWNYFKVWK